MTIDEVKAKQAELQSTLHTALKAFQRETGVIVDAVEVRQIDLSTYSGPQEFIPEVRVRLKWD